MKKEASPRVVGCFILFLGLFMIGLNWFHAADRSTFFPIMSVLGPLATAYSVSVIIRPPPAMPQEQLEPIHKIFLAIGSVLGVAYFLLLKFGIIKGSA